MMLDETCFFLAIDLDKANWKDDASAVMETCRRLEIHAVLERSRSGNGAHVWMFFESAVPASVARRLGSHVLTETMERRPDIGLDSYDRFFPNQDTLPRGGFGNLIALPLQKQPRNAGNSVFVDDEFTPYSDQWALLSSTERMPRAKVEELVSRATRGGRIINVRVADDSEPWNLPPTESRGRPRPVENSPVKVELILADQIYIPKEKLPPGLRNRLTRLAAFQNPEFYKAQSMRLPTWGKPRIISCAEDHPQHLALPRGCIEDIQRLLNDLRIKFDTRDERTVGESINLKFQGDMRPGQVTAVQ